MPPAYGPNLKGTLVLPTVTSYSNIGVLECFTNSVVFYQIFLRRTKGESEFLRRNARTMKKSWRTWKAKLMNMEIMWVMFGKESVKLVWQLRSGMIGHSVLKIVISISWEQRSMIAPEGSGTRKRILGFDNNRWWSVCISYRAARLRNSWKMKKTNETNRMNRSQYLRFALSFLAV